MEASDTGELSCASTPASSWVPVQNGKYKCLPRGTGSDKKFMAKDEAKRYANSIFDKELLGGTCIYMIFMLIAVLYSLLKCKLHHLTFLANFDQNKNCL